MRKEILAILRELHDDMGDKFEDSKDFVEDELLDSFDIISLVSILEEKFQINIDAFDIVPENFTSLEMMEKLVQKSRNSIEP